MILNCCQRSAGQSFDSVEQANFFSVTKRQRGSCGACTGGAADAVDITLGIIGQFVVDHVRNPFDVDPSCNDVGADEYFDATPVEGRESLLTRILSFVGMNGVGGDALFGQMPHEAIGQVFCAREDQGPQNVFVF